jgi:hypothetical protein
MLNDRQNIKVFNPDSIIVLLIVFFGLSICNNFSGSFTDSSRKPVTTYISTIESSAVISSCIKLQIFQKTWISNKDNFNLLAFNRNPLSENKKSDLKISNLQHLRQCSNIIPQFILRYHLFPAEKDEPPHLS